MRLLLAEDNRELAHWLEKALVQNGFAVDCVFDGLAADHAKWTSPNPMVMSEHWVSPRW